MTTSPFVTSPHPAAGGHQTPHASIPGRRPGRPFVPAPVQTGVGHLPDADTDQAAVADAVLQLLRSVDQHGARPF